jgi:hypothetical protein
MSSGHVRSAPSEGSQSISASAYPAPASRGESEHVWFPWHTQRIGRCNQVDVYCWWNQVLTGFSEPQKWAFFGYRETLVFRIIVNSSERGWSSC